MDNLLSGLEAVGLKNLDNIDLFGKHENKEDKSAAVKKDEAPTEESFLFDKTYKCPVCDNEFKERIVKTGKAKLTAQDLDLRPRYKDIDCLKYDIAVCPICGYAALLKGFEYLGLPQAKLVKEKISSSFTGLGTPKSVYSYDDAITRHKLALVNSVVKRSKISERAYLCLILAWLTRGKRETLSKNTSDYDNVIKQLKSDELDLLRKAHDGFNEAFTKETFPLSGGLDENTSTYLVAELARRIGSYDEAGRWISRLLTSKNANDRIKGKAREVKELITKAQAGQ